MPQNVSNADIVDNRVPRTLDAACIAIDTQLRTLAEKRAALDAEEARLLRKVVQLQVWRRLGYASPLDYLERSVGYWPRTAKDRLRVAKALGKLPAIERALEAGKLAFSAVRELTRIATPDNEANWVKAVEGCNLRQIEEAVACHVPGDQPTDPPKPIIRSHDVTFALTPDVYAMLGQVRTLVAEERGQYVDDNELIGTLLRAQLDRGSPSQKVAAPRFTVSVTVCESCEQAVQHGGGREIPVDKPIVEMACCDATLIGSIDGDVPERASSEIPPAIRRFVWHRDGGRCQTPGCRSTVGVAIHHIDPRARGGKHHPSNLTCRCYGCHLGVHTGALEITGTAPNNLVTRRIKQPELSPIALAERLEALSALPAAEAASRIEELIDERLAAPNDTTAFRADRSEPQRFDNASSTRTGVIEQPRESSESSATSLEDTIAPTGEPDTIAPAAIEQADGLSMRPATAVEDTIAPTGEPDPIEAIEQAAGVSMRPGTAVEDTIAPTDEPDPIALAAIERADVAVEDTSTPTEEPDPIAPEIMSPATALDDAIAPTGESGSIGTEVVAQARAALVALGWKRPIAQAAVNEARAHVGTGDIAALIFEALRRCPKPGGSCSPLAP